VQIKQNQPNVFEAVARLAEQAEQAEPTEPAGSPSFGVVMTTVDKGHGRLEERVGRILPLKRDVLAERWDSTGMQTLIVMDRMTEKLKTGKTSGERSYYVSNQPSLGHEQELFDAVRGHWRIESTHYIRDVTLNEDHIRTKHANEGQVLSLLRTVALKFLQSVHPTNVQALLEQFVDVPESLRNLLVRSHFVPTP
jgi:predicted transposase YbfD/YdcC